VPGDTPRSFHTDEALEAVDLENRRRRLVVVGLCCSIASLLIALLAGTMFWPTPIGWWSGLLIATVVGSFVGLAQAPILGLTIARRKPLLAAPLVYLGAALVCLLVLQTRQGAWAVVAFTFTVPLLASLAMLLPSQRLGRRDRCYSCGYDLSGHPADACPECGSPVLTPVEPLPAAERQP